MRRRKEIDGQTELIMGKSIKRRGIEGLYKPEKEALSGRGAEERAAFLPLRSSVCPPRCSAAPLQRLRLSAVRLWIFTIRKTEISACIYLVAPF